jgi:hypothetical protein
MAKDRKRSKPPRASALARQLEQMRAGQERLDRGGGIPPVPPDARRHVEALLARRQETADEKWLAALRVQGEAGQAVEAVEAWVRDHLYDEQAGLVYAELIHRAAASPDPGEHERKALERFRDRSGLDAVKGAVHDYLEEHPGWDEFIKGKAARDLDSLPARRLSAGALRECAAILLEAAVRGADLAMRDKAPKDIRGLHRGNHEPRTLMGALAEDPATPPEVARRAADWAEYAYYGLWQLRDPVPSPGVEGVDLASGGRLYLDFPPGKLDGAAPWSVWLGGAVPVDGVWHVTGTGLMLSPREGDAIAEAVEKEVERMIATAAGMPAAELGAIAPVNYDDPPPQGVRWEHFTPVGPVYGGGGPLLRGRFPGAGVHGDDGVDRAELQYPGHHGTGADDREQAATGLEPAVRPDDLVQGGGVDEHEPGHVEQELAGALRALGGKGVRQDLRRRGVGLAR